MASPLNLFGQIMHLLLKNVIGVSVAERQGGDEYPKETVGAASLARP